MATRLFGTDGVRGKANAFPLTAEGAVKLGQAIGLVVRSQTPRSKHLKILIGKDTRRSGYLLENALSAGLCSVGVDVLVTGPLPTAGVAYLTKGLRLAAGMMISASHNPYEDNGIKIFDYDGFKLSDAIEDEIEKIFYSDIDQQLAGYVGKVKRIDDAIGQYAVFLKEKFPKHLSLESLRLGIDAAHGAAYKVAPKVFSELGADVFTIGDQPNGRNINLDCGSMHPEALQSFAVKNELDLGFCLDGDADRLIVVDEQGLMIPGDQVLGICAAFMHERGGLRDNTVVGTSMSNVGLEKYLNGRGIKLVRTKVGDRYIVEKLRQDQLMFGGEPSGHLIFLESSSTGDGILAALKLLQIKLETGRTLHDLRQEIVLYPQKIKSLLVQEKVPLEDLPAFSKKLAQANHGPDTRIVFRYSGTENLARIMVEAKTEEKVDEILADLEQSFLSELPKK